MRRCVGEVYVEIFKLLCQALGWLKSKAKRVKAAIHCDFHPKHVQPFVDSIHKAIQRMRDEVYVITCNTTQSIKEDILTVKDACKWIKEVLIDVILSRESRNDSAEMSKTKLAQVGAELGKLGVEALSSVEQQATYGESNSSDHSLHGSASSQTMCLTLNLATDHNLRATRQNAHVVSFHTPTLNTGQLAAPDQEQESQCSISEEVESIGPEGKKRPSTGLPSSGESNFNPTDFGEPAMHRSDLEHHIHGLLARYLEDGRMDIARNPRDASFTTLPSEVLVGLQKWISALKSTMVWVSGEDATPFGSGLSVAALKLCDVSKEIGIPCISFISRQRYSFCTPDPANKSGMQEQLDPQEAGLIALFYTVIAQLILLLPDDPFPVNPVLEKSNFEKLDGTMASAPVALQIIRELASYAPPSLIWIFDNIQLAENKTTRPHLKAFMDFLREQERKTNAAAAREEGKMPYSKVCFTTDGNSLVLNTTTNARTERIDASRMAQRRPGRPLRGGSDVSELAWRKR